MPKSTQERETEYLAKLMDEHVKLQRHVEAAQLVFNKNTAVAKARMEAIEEELKQAFTMSMLRGMRTASARIEIRDFAVPKVTSQAMLVQYVKKMRGKADDLLSFNPMTRACQERWREGIEIPGIEKVEFSKVYVKEVK